MMVSITITAISGQTTGQFVEQADFGIVVVPEFPVSVAIIAAIVIGLIVVVTRMRGMSLTGMPSKRPSSP